MAYEKPTIIVEAASKIIVENLGGEPENITETTDGQIAKVFKFEIGAEEYFIHFNPKNMSQGFKTEIRFEEKLRKASIPVRAIVKSGIYSEYHYAITRKVKGKSLQRDGLQL